jgi:hypothetical protein
MRPAMIDNEQKWKDTAGFAAKRVLDGGYSGKEAMDLFGAMAEGDIKKAISDVLAPPFSLITLMARKYRKLGKKVTGKTIGEIAGRIKKGDVDISGVSTKPLVDTGKMIATGYAPDGVDAMMPGGNILGMALRVIKRQSFLYYKFKGR